MRGRMQEQLRPMKRGQKPEDIIMRRWYVGVISQRSVVRGQMIEGNKESITANVSDECELNCRRCGEGSLL